MIRAFALLLLLVAAQLLEGCAYYAETYDRDGRLMTRTFATGAPPAPDLGETFTAVTKGYGLTLTMGSATAGYVGTKVAVIGRDCFSVLEVQNMAHLKAVQLLAETLDNSCITIGDNP